MAVSHPAVRTSWLYPIQLCAVGPYPIQLCALHGCTPSSCAPWGCTPSSCVLCGRAPSGCVHFMAVPHPAVRRGAVPHPAVRHVAVPRLAVCTAELNPVQLCAVRLYPVRLCTVHLSLPILPPPLPFSPPFTISPFSPPFLSFASQIPGPLPRPRPTPLPSPPAPHPQLLLWPPLPSSAPGSRRDMEPGVLLACLGAVLTSCRGAGLDVETVTVFHGDASGAFGQTVAQFGTTDDGGVLVGAPLQRGAVNQTGMIYQCQHRSGKCQEVPVTGPPEAINTSLGLALAAGGTEALACGPTVPQACGENIHLNGFCVLLDTNLQQLQRIPDAQAECPKRSSDVVLLIDGSGSIRHREFLTMKTFIVEVMRRFKGTDTQFALTQFSNIVLTHFDFNTFRRSHDPTKLLNQVQQLGSVTRTATAIWTVLTQMFIPGRGAREDANKILIVITDGQKFDDEMDYPGVIPLADKMGVTRYAIGVGSAFTEPKAVEELHTIASKPSKDHVFRVDNFDALQGIQNQLQEKIFAIEGTQSADSSSFQLEMAQEGFSALLTPEGPLGAVGAYDWSGGVFVYGRSETTFVNVSRAARDMNDAYLGYAAESLSLEGSRALALGAPRYRHVGRLLLFRLRGPRAAWELVADATGTQVGSYFGASLCALDADGDGSAEVVLAGAPMFYGAEGGRVAVCTLRPKGGRLPCQQTLQGQRHPLGRFGASLARLGDVDGDRWPDVAVGAPLEDDERAVYIFRGKRGGVASQYSQRISGARFSSGPRYFGQAISGGQDLTGDRLPDVAVGARGQVLLLRSQPLLKVRVTVAFQPQEIPAAAFDCQEEEALKGEVAKANICFLSTKKTPDNFGRQLSTTLRYQAALDPGRAMARAVFAGSAAVRNGTLQLGVGQRCETFAIAFTGCPRDTLAPLVLRLTYDATGDPIAVAGGLRPALSEDSEMVAVGTLPFEKNCGADNICVDDLQISFNFSGLETVVVGVTDVVDITVTLRNRGEDSYGATVQLHHAEALSYRKAVVLQSSRRSPSLRCNSEPAAGPRRRTLCLVNHPIFRPGTEVVFTVTLDVPNGAELGGALEVVANASSDNGLSGGREQRAEIPVKYGVFLVLTSAPDSTKYVNVSTRAGAPASAPVAHRYEVKILGQRGLPINVTFLVPTALGGTPLWEKVEVTPDQGCAVAACRELQCRVRELEPPRALGFSLGGSLALGWVATSQQPKVVVQSSARLDYDVGRYWNTGGGAQLQVQTEVERLETPDPLPLILGGTVGGLVLLGLLALVLYKVGFFKRRYKELMEGDGSPTAPLGDPQG
ncbi:LOW QUALITY PROTEIN: integrin alpha-M-like [Ciconia maguari]